MSFMLLWAAIWGIISDYTMLSVMYGNGAGIGIIHMNAKHYLERANDKLGILNAVYFAEVVGVTQRQKHDQLIATLSFQIIGITIKVYVPLDV